MNQTVVDILNIVEDKLREFNIQIPDDDREDSSDPIVGYRYAELHDLIKEYLEDRGMLPIQKDPLQIKVVIDSGIVDDVLINREEAVEVEILDIDNNYEDYKQLDEYRHQIYSDPSLRTCPYSVARFEPEEEPVIEPPLDLTDIAGIDPSRITANSRIELRFNDKNHVPAVRINISYDEEAPSECLSIRIYTTETLFEAQKLVAFAARKYGIEAFDESKVSLTRFPVKVELESIGEGYHGDYNPNDPHDEMLLRFYTSVCREGVWEEKEDASYCTQLPIHLSVSDQKKALQLLLNAFYPELKDDIDVSIKKVAEKMSWLSPESLSEESKSLSTLDEKIVSATERKHDNVSNLISPSNKEIQPYSLETGERQ